jgi:hypothetical protein
MKNAMHDIFKIIADENELEPNKRQICIGIDLRIADKDIRCPISRVCHTYKDLAAEMECIQKRLDRLREEAKTFFEGSVSKGRFEFAPETSPEEVWSVLSGIQEEPLFVKRFNSLEETKRKEVAEYVLTRCNIFSGRGAIFSAQYNSETGYME